jgi:small conductance mechanosensitive channel
MQTSILPAELTGLAGLAWAWTLAFAPRLLAAIIILVVGLVAASRIARGSDRLLGGVHRLDPTIRPFITAAVQYGILIIVLLLVLGQLGIQTTSLLAVLGAAGLAIGLSLQATLSNIAAGLMLLWLRPFEIGDYVEVGTVAGTVETTGLFACLVRNFDGARMFVPNSVLWNVALRNHSRAALRLIALSVTIAPEADPEQAADLIARLEMVDRQNAPVVYLDSFDAGGAVLGCRVWVAHGRYGEAQRLVVGYLRHSLAAGAMPALAIKQIGRTVPVSADSYRLLDL